MATVLRPDFTAGTARRWPSPLADPDGAQAVLAAVIIERSGHTDGEIAAMLPVGVTARMVARWRAEKSAPPAASLIVLAALEPAAAFEVISELGARLTRGEEAVR